MMLARGRSRDTFAFSRVEWGGPKARLARTDKAATLWLRPVTLAKTSLSLSLQHPIDPDVVPICLAFRWLGI
jgi:hypothetical protein